MKIFHLSDLHLGKRVFEASMLEEQRAMLDWAVVQAKDADVTILAGDIYDRQVPPAEAVALFDQFLTRMSEQHSVVLMISGNHDSAERIAFGANLLDRSGVYVSPVYGGEIRFVDIPDAFGTVRFHLLPFVKPAHVRAALCAENGEKVESYTDAVRLALTKAKLDAHVRHVLIAHQFVTGATRSDSEEISIGGLDQVDADVFAPFDYVALGHLHTAQALCAGRIRYAGSPLSYAFSECGAERGGLMITLDRDGCVLAEKRVYTPNHPMCVVRGAFEDLHRLENYMEDYVQAILTDEDNVPDAARKLMAVYPNLLQVIYDNTRTRTASARFEHQPLPETEPLLLFEKLYQMQFGRPMEAESHDWLRDLMTKIWDEGEDA